MGAAGKWKASPLPSRSGKHHEELTSSSCPGASCGAVCEVRYDKLLLMSCFPEADPSPKWTQITPAGLQLPPSRNWENWAGTSVEWEGFPASEASGWPTQDPVLLAGRKAVGSPHPAPLTQPWKGGWAMSSGVSPTVSRLAAHRKATIQKTWRALQVLVGMSGILSVFPTWCMKIVLGLEPTSVHSHTETCTEIYNHRFTDMTSHQGHGAPHTTRVSRSRCLSHTARECCHHDSSRHNDS